MRKNIRLFSFCIFLLSFVLAEGENVVRRGDLLIDLDTGNIIEAEGETGTIPSPTTSAIPSEISASPQTTEIETAPEITGVDTISPPAAPIISSLSTGSTGNNSKDELENAILRMYANGLTKFGDKLGYQPDTFLTREQIAKMITQAYKVLGFSGGKTDDSCDFSDIETADPSLRPYIKEACQLGLLKGWDAAFHPAEELTRAQTITLLIRMMAGKSDENTVPRRSNYIKQAQTIGLTKTTDLTSFEQPIPRGDVALLIYRFKSIEENSLMKNSALQEMQQAINDSPTKIDAQKLDDSLSLLVQGLAISTNPELREAIFRMYQQGVTEYPDVEKFRAFDQIQRQEAAKFIGQFHQKFIKTGEISGQIPDTCYFNDIDDAEDHQKPYILYLCQQGIIEGENGLFRPTHALTKAEFIATLIRTLGKNIPTTGNQERRKPYFDMGLQLGLITYDDEVGFVRKYPITRYEVALILYRFYTQYTFFDNLNSDRLENMVIEMVANSEKEVAGEKQGKVYITTVKLKDQDFSIGYIELFATRYKIVKESVEKYLMNDFVRYGHVYDLATNKAIGTMSLQISDNTVLRGNIRPELSGTTYYEISRPKETGAYYIIKEKKE